MKQKGYAHQFYMFVGVCIFCVKKTGRRDVGGGGGQDSSLRAERETLLFECAGQMLIA
jgi:hypothetical protein